MHARGHFKPLRLPLSDQICEQIRGSFMLPQRAGLNQHARVSPLLVPRDRGQLGHVLQQNAPALQVQNAVLAPELQLTVDAFARGADEDAELLLRDVHLGAEIGGQRSRRACPCLPLEHSDSRSAHR